MKRTKKLFMLLLTLLLMFATFSVNASAASTSKTIKLDSSKATMAVGQTKDIKLLNTTGSKKATWKSSDKSVVTVKSAGQVTAKLTAKKAGTATVTAKFDGKTYSCKVTVKKTQLSDTSMKLTVGMNAETIKLQYTTGTKKATWKSSNTSVVTVKSAGRVTAKLTAKKAGTATITAKFAGKTYSCKVMVRTPILNISSVTIGKGEKKSVKLNYVYGENNVDWKSSDSSVVSVKRTGRTSAKLCAEKVGMVTVTAKVYGKNYKCKVKVKEISLSDTSLNLTAGATNTVKLNYTSSNEKITWESSNISVATVKSTGDATAKIVAKKAGTTTITAKYGSKSYECKITVKSIKPSHTSLSMAVNETQKIKLSNIFGSQKVAWKSSNMDVAEVKSSGQATATVTAKKAGTAIVTASIYGKKYKFNITVKKYRLNETDITFYYGNTIDYGKEYVGQNYTDYTAEYSANLCLIGNRGEKKVTWKSSNPSVARVDSKGKVVPTGLGTATIIATVGGKNYKCSVYVKTLDLYFWNKLTDPESALKSYWSLDNAKTLCTGSTIRYKIMETEYYNNGNIKKETDVTQRIKLTPNASKVFSVDYKKGTISAIKTTEKYSDYNINAVLQVYDIYGDGSDERTKQDVFFGRNIQKISFNMFPVEETEWLEEMVCMDSSLALDEEILYPGDEIDLYASEKINSGTFDGNNVFLPGIESFLYTNKKFSWHSSDEGILKVTGVYGSGGYWWDRGEMGFEGSLKYVSRATVRLMKPGIACITLKYGDIIVGECKIRVFDYVQEGQADGQVVAPEEKEPDMVSGETDFGVMSDIPEE